MQNTLVVITGATASGKTELAVQLAQCIGCDIISADSRQIYRGLPIGTAVPSEQQLSRARHHFVSMLDLDEPYSAARYEADVLQLLPRLWQQSPVQIMCGGSMMYIDAVTRGIDELPTISGEVRSRVASVYAEQGLEAVRSWLRQLDPAGWAKVDPHNPRRNIHAVEICLEAGRPCSELLTGQAKPRNFDVLKYYIDMPRDELFGRINARVDAMMASGLEQEARAHLQQRHLNSLNTVGYKEMFAYIDGVMDYDTAVARIAKNTRVYAKKQLTWLKRDASAVAVTSLDDVLAHLRQSGIQW